MAREPTPLAELDDETIEIMADAALGPDDDAGDESDPLYLPESCQLAKAEFRAAIEERVHGARLTALPDVANLLTARRKRAFIVALAKTGVVGTAAARAGLSRRAVVSLRKADKEFEQLWDDALEFAADVAEQEAFHRGVDGEPEPVFFKGAKVGEVIRKSDRMLELVLKSRRPEKYRETYKVDADVKGGVLVTPMAAGPEAWEAAAADGQAKNRGNGGVEAP